MSARFPVKLFEVRDRATFIPVMAVALFHSGAEEGSESESYLLRRAGYSAQQIDPLKCAALALEPYIMLVALTDARANYDPYSWGNRTLAAAHEHIILNWDSLISGAVLDVEFILGEKPTPKVSERLTAPL